MKSEQHVSTVEVEQYVAGVMDAGEIEAFEAHVEVCDTCARSLQQEAALEMELMEAVAGGDAGRAEEITRVARRPRARPLALAVAAIAAAAAVAILVFRPVPPASVELPGYRLETAGGARAVRSTDPSPEGLPRFRPGDRMQLDLRPEAGAPESPQLRVFLDRIGEKSIVDGVAWEFAGSGAVRGVATVGETLRLPPGEHQLILALATTDTPFDPGRIQACHAGEEGPWQTFAYRFEVVEP